MKAIFKNFECPVCKKEIGTYVKGEPEECNGISIQIGGSEGGWGSRFNTIVFSEEVCDDCFLNIMKKSEELRELLGLSKDETLWQRLHKFFTN